MIFDIVILDTPSFSSLTGTSRSALLSSVEQQGLGVFIQPDGGFFTLSRKQSYFEFTRNNNAISLVNWPRAVVTTFDYRFQEDALLVPLVTTNDDVLAAATIRNNGKIATALFQNTYQWLLDGQDQLYKSIWSEILSGIAKRDEQLVDWEEPQQRSRVDEPFTIIFQTQIPTPDVYLNDSIRIAIKNDLHQDDLWEVTVYPKEKGWNTLSVKQDSLHNYSFFVTDSAVFKAKSTYEKQLANEEYFNRDRAQTFSNQGVNIPIPRVWFLIAFVLAMGFLWFEPRFTNY